MVAPIDYTSQVASPFESAVQGLRFGAGIAEMQRAAQQREAAALAQRQQREVLTSLLNNKNATAEDYAKATLAAPGMQKQLQQSWEMHSEGEKEKSLSEITSVYSALQADKPEIAADILNRRAEALRNSGGPQDQIDVAERMAKMAIEAPDYLRTQAGIQLASIPGGDKILESAAKSAETRRKEGLYPGELLKQGADIGLTEAQTKRTLAEVDKLGAEAKKAILELEGAGKSGIVDPEKRFDAEEKLRKNYLGETKSFSQMQDAFRRISKIGEVYTEKGATDEDKAAGDLGLVYSIMKLYDPGSTVMQGEQASASNAGGVPAQILNVYNSLLGKGSLTKGQRSAFMGQGKKLFSAAEKREKEIRGLINKSVRAYGLDERNVFPEVEGSEQPEVAEVAPRVITVDY